MRMLVAALLAAILAASTAAPTFAADRPVGPETGQARVGESDGNREAPDPDEASNSENDWRELSWNSDALTRWMQWYERNVGPIGF